MTPDPLSFDLDPSTPWGRSVTEAEFAEMCRAGRLGGAALERYWRMSEFGSPMPEYLDIMVRKRDVDRLIRQLRRDGELPKIKRRRRR